MAYIDDMINEYHLVVSFGHALLRSWKLMQTKIIPYFLMTWARLEAHEAYEMG